ncbi:MAG TPA: adenylate/guanylate cyclase domain-containing protein [Acidimicrobiales bacterium]|nr:adenylate/guanylate cyclase domain-containing protein [Acidimicrobiales bacterium]
MRVRRTFAFLDLSGFTALTATEGDERSVAVLEVFRGALRRVCSRRGVRIAKWLGDGAMIVGTESTPVLAVVLEMQCAVDLLAEHIDLKCGVTTGPVILLEGDDYIGHAVNLAARLCDLACAGEVLADLALQSSLPLWTRVLDQRSVAVRGVDVPVPVLNLALPLAGPGMCLDPICGIPLTADTAVASRAAGGAGTWLFCSDSCLDTWESRPGIAAPAPEAFVRDGIV